MLTSAGLPPAGALGPDAIRFSTQPSLGGRAVVVELVRSAGGRGRTRIIWGDGHPYQGWKIAGSVRRSLSAGEYRRIAGIVDSALASYRPDPTTESEIIICTDGPEYLTERVRRGRVVTLSGSCPLSKDEPHPNDRIAAVLLSLACGPVIHQDPEDLDLRRDCGRWHAETSNNRGS